MKIAQVAPLSENVPQNVTATELVVSYLTEGLLKLGHEVTLCARGDSLTRAPAVCRVRTDIAPT